MVGNRRDFASGLVGLGSTLLLYSCKSATSQSQVRDDNSLDATPGPGDTGEAAAIRVRKSIWDLDPKGPELNDYRKAIKAMSALPASDHRSWEGQADIHFNSCPHSNWFFLPWHRAYLFYFEKLIQKYSGNANWALPYWDWTKKPELPPAFTDSTGGNALFHPDRAAKPPIPADAVGPDVIKKMMGTRDFITFASGRANTQRGDAATGFIEGTPHNTVHGWVDGDMGDFHSPRDPIFWLHHCNIDRLWAEWAAVNAATRLPPDSTKASEKAMTRAFYLGFTLSGYFDTENKAATAKVSDTQMTSKYGYRYDTTTDAGSASLALDDVAPTETVTADVQSDPGQLTQTGSFATIAVPVSQDLSTAFANFITATNQDPTTAVARLYVDAIPVPDDLTLVLRIFLGNTQLSASTQDSDPTFVGRYAFFGMAHDGHMGNSRNAMFDLTPTIQAQYSSATAVPAELDFQIQLIGPDGSTPDATAYAGMNLTIEFSTLS